MNSVHYEQSVQHHRPAPLPDRFELEGGRLTVYRRTRSRFWQMRARPPGYPEYVRKSLKTTNASEACDLARREYMRLEMKLEEGLPIRTRKFSDAIKKYREWLDGQLKIGGKSEYMARNLLGSLNRYVEPYFGSHDISAFRVDSADQLSEGYYQWRVANSKDGSKTAPAWKTVNFEYMAVNGVVDHAVKLNWVDARNVCRLKRPRFVATPTNRRPGFSEEEYQKLYVFMRSWVKAKDKRLAYTRQMIRHMILVMVIPVGGLLMSGTPDT